MPDDQINAERALRKLRENPQKVIDDARRGSMQDLLELANLWEHTPHILSMGVLTALFTHLDSDTAPTDPSRAQGRFPALDRAFMSLVGLSKVGNHLTDSDTYGSTIVQAWPGVFKWSAFFFAGRVQHKSVKPEVQKANLDVISAAWYSLSRSESARKVMSATKGSIEIATQMCMLEDKGNLPSFTDIPTASAALDALLKDANGPALNRVVAAAGGNTNNVVQFMLSRLRTSINSTRPYDSPTVVYLDLVGHLSRDPDHALRHAFLGSDTIVLCTKIALAVSKLLNTGTGGPLILLDTMVAAFGYLTNCLESTDGFTWVSQSIQAGLLTAFVDCSPHYSKLDPDDCDMVLTIVRNILPKYLVYRSVIQVIDGTIRKLGDPPHHERIKASVAWDIWVDFHKLALERYMVTMQATAMKGKGATCDNVHCQKVDVKNNFRKCGSCSTTLYCSKECQVASWKEGHRDMCKMKQRERLEGKYQSISKRDATFFHHLFTRDARSHLPRLRKLASTTYPSLTRTALLICIDYTVIPPAYSVVPLEEYDKPKPSTSNGSSNIEARNEALIERARDNPGKFTIIQSKIANGQGLQSVLTVVTGGFWKDGPDAWDEDGDEEDEVEEGEDEFNGRQMDDIDLMMGRMALNGFLRKMGQPPAF